MVLLFWDFVHIEKHGPQYVKKQFWLVVWAALNHHSHGLQHCCQ